MASPHRAKTCPSITRETMQVSVETLTLLSTYSSPEFDDFNFSPACDLSMKRRISQAALIPWVIQGRKDYLDDVPTVKLADAMYFTLRPPAFEAYQRVHVAVAISYPEWFYLKLRQFIGIAFFDELEVKSMVDGSRKRMALPIEKGYEITGVYCHQKIGFDELTESIVPEDNDFGTWLNLVATAHHCTDNRLQELQEWLKRHRRASDAQISPKSRWTKNRQRDALIRHELFQKTERIEICRKLDEAGIDTTPGLQEHGFSRWLDAWLDPDGRQLVQTLFSKVARR
jgi:hypothetical protein